MGIRLIRRQTELATHYSPFTTSAYAALHSPVASFERQKLLHLIEHTVYRCTAVTNDLNRQSLLLTQSELLMKVA